MATIKAKIIFVGVTYFMIFTMLNGLVLTY
jgi:hypothetical protein